MGRWMRTHECGDTIVRRPLTFVETTLGDSFPCQPCPSAVVPSRFQDLAELGAIADPEYTQPEPS